MSKTYVVKIGTVSAESRERRDVVCPPIVPEMPSLLGAELAARGWDVAEDKARKTFDGVEVEVDLRNPSLELKSGAKVAVVGKSYDAADNDVRGRAAARKDAEAKRGEAGKRAKAKAEQALLKVDDEVRAEVTAAVKGALLEALQRKAAQLGRVQGVEHGKDADGRPVTTIRVEV